MTAYPGKIYPWVIHDIIEPRHAYRYLKKDFIEKELGFREPWCTYSSYLLGSVCVRIMKGIGAIPVYHTPSKIRGTLSRSLEILSKGYPLVVFPEIPGTEGTKYLEDFNTGFINLARSFYKKTGKRLNLYPVAIHKPSASVALGDPVCYSPDVPFPREKILLKRYLMETITEMYDEMEDLQGCDVLPELLM